MGSQLSLEKVWFDEGQHEHLVICVEKGQVDLLWLFDQIRDQFGQNMEQFGESL